MVTREEVVHVRGAARDIAHRQARLELDAHHRNGSSPALSVVVIAGNELLRSGIAGMLRVVPEVGPVHEVTGPADVALSGMPAGPDLIVVTATDAGVLAERDRYPDARILVVVDPASVSRLAGGPSGHADGYLWQPSLTTANLWDTVRRALRGELPVPPELTHALMSRVHDSVHRPRSVNLTSREREALALLVKGLSNKQIARRLAISGNGAKRLVTSILLKLDAPNRTVAAVLAIRAGLVDEDI